MSDVLPTTPPVLKLQGVTKRYRDKSVLDGTDLDIPAGSVVGLLGKNGAGKTTLLKVALGLIKPDAGIATLLGEPAWSLSADAKARLGYVPQVVTLYPWMRLREAGYECVVAAPEVRSSQLVLHERPEGWHITRETPG